MTDSPDERDFDDVAGAEAAGTTDEPDAEFDSEFDDEPDECADGDEVEFEVHDEPHTVCHLCGGAGMIADHKLAIVSRLARTVDNGRPCHGCDATGHFHGIRPPV